MRFINFQEKTKVNFNKLKTQLKGLGTKIDSLREMLLNVSNMCCILYIFVILTTHFKIYSYILCNFILKTRGMSHTVLKWKNEMDFKSKLEKFETLGKAMIGRLKWTMYLMKH